MAKLRLTNCEYDSAYIKSHKINLTDDDFGRVYHSDDFEFYPEGTKIDYGDLVWYRHYQHQNTGYLLISESQFVTDPTNGHSFTFCNNPYYQGMSQRNHAIIYFARKIKSIKKINRLRPVFCKVTNINGDKVTVKSEENKHYLLHMPCQVNGTIGNAIWGYVNERHSQFASFDGNYPINSIEID